MWGEIVPMRSSRVTVCPHKISPWSEALIDQKRKERSLLWSVHLALQHLSGARHFGQAPRCEYEPN